MAWYDEFIGGGGGAVDSFNGRTGAVVPESGDYTIEQVTDGTTTKMLAYNSSSTGWHNGGVLSANVDTAKFDLTSGSGVVIDNTTDPNNPTETTVTWSSFSAQTVTNIATQPVTYISINSSGNIVQSSNFPNATLRRTNIFLGVLVHSNNTNINAINLLPSVGFDTNAQLQDLMNGLGFFSVSGNLISSNGANLNIDKSAGVGFKAGANAQNDNSKPHEFDMSVLTAATFRYRNQDGSEGSDTTLIDPTTYDNGGVTTTVPANNDATIQRVYIFPSNIIRIQRGQEVFNNLAQAIERAGTETFVIETNIAENGLFLGSIAVRKDATDLSNINQAKFIPSSQIAGAIGFETTLQQAYDVSTNPEIITDATRGAVTIQRGSGADTDNVLELKNGVGTNTFEVDGNGDVTANEVNGVALTSAGGGTNYLADDGTYKTVSGGSGDVTGPVSSNTNAVPVFDDTTGKVIADSSGDGTFRLGNLKIDNIVANGAGLFNNAQSGNNFMLFQNSGGGVTVNSASGQALLFRIGNSVSTTMTLQTTGGVQLAGAGGAPGGQGTINTQGCLKNGVEYAEGKGFNLYTVQSDVTILGSIAWQDLTDLNETLDANTSYLVEVLINVESNYTTGSKQAWVRVNQPAWSEVSLITSIDGGTNGDTIQQAGNTPFGMVRSSGSATRVTDVAVYNTFLFKGVVTTDGAGGDLQIEVRNGTNTVGEGFTFKANSYMKVTKID